MPKPLAEPLTKYLCGSILPLRQTVRLHQRSKVASVGAGPSCLCVRRSGFINTQRSLVYERVHLASASHGPVSSALKGSSCLCVRRSGFINTQRSILPLCQTVQLHQRSTVHLASASDYLHQRSTVARSNSCLHARPAMTSARQAMTS